MVGAEPPRKVWSPPRPFGQQKASTNVYSSLRWVHVQSGRAGERRRRSSVAATAGRSRIIAGRVGHSRSLQQSGAGALRNRYARRIFRGHHLVRAGARTVGARAARHSSTGSAGCRYRSRDGDLGRAPARTAHRDRATAPDRQRIRVLLPVPYRRCDRRTGRWNGSGDGAALGATGGGRRVEPSGKQRRPRSNSVMSVAPPGHVGDQRCAATTAASDSASSSR